MSSLLGADDPPPFTVVNPEASTPLLLLCDHASKAVPKKLARLGLSDADLSRHIGWDIGAAEVARRLSRDLDATLVLSGYSRLVIDCNRRPGHPTSIAPVSDGIEVPGNFNLSEAERAERAEACFWPYHRAIGRAIDAKRAHGLTPALVVIHSFTPSMAGFDRPWHVGILWDDDARLAAPLLEHLRRRDDLVVGDNEPYSGRGEHEFTIGMHGRPGNLPRVSIEVRQDLIADPAGCDRYAEILAPALREAVGLPPPRLDS